jgi:hypothetical protein
MPLRSAAHGAHLEMKSRQMKRFCSVLALSISLVGFGIVGAASEAAPLAAQVAAPAQPDIGRQRSAMARLNYLSGRWLGEVTLTKPTGEIVKSRSEDDISFINEGTVLTIKGRAFAPGATATAAHVSENLGILSYDDRDDRYELRAYSHGNFITGDVLSVRDGEGQWLLGSSQGLLRFTAKATGANGWTEIIERSDGADGKWVEMMEVHFTRRPAE